MPKQPAEPSTQSQSKRRRVHEDDTALSLEDNVNWARTILLDRVSERAVPDRLCGLDAEYNQLHHLLNQTISKGESNSCLLLGNRGTGKTMLLSRVLNDLEKTFSANNKRDFTIVRLNGQIQNTDRLALTEIARQLLLEQHEDQPDQGSGRSFSSFADSFAYILSLLKSGDKSSIPVIFVLEEFDAFAEQPKQMLLYYLFDAVQSAQSPIAVIGLTCRLDVVLLLEKRVKSRFSHRQIYLYPQKTLGDFVGLATEILRLPTSQDDSPERADYVKEFNQSVESLMQDASAHNLLRHIFELTKDIRMFLKICFLPVSRLTAEHRFLEASHFVESSKTQWADSKTEIMKGVSLLELVLIVAMKKLLEKDITVFNFQMVYEEYKEFMTQTQVRGAGFGIKLYKQPVALKAFENMQALELVRPVEDVAKCPKEYRMTKMMLEMAEVTEAVLKYKDCPSIIKKWVTGAA